MALFIIFKTTVPEGTPLSLLLVRWGSLFFSCFVLYSPTTTDIYPLFTCDPLQFTLNTLRLFCTVRTKILYIFLIYFLFKVVVYPLASLIYLRFRGLLPVLAVVRRLACLGIRLTLPPSPRIAHNRAIKGLEV